MACGILYMEMVHFIPTNQRHLTMLATQADTAPVLILGGSGTGKSAIARWIHNNGPRSGRPLIEAKRKEPLAAQLALAQGGSFVIPEISEWPLGEQKLLLNFLNTRSIPHPENPALPMLLNVRVIATAHPSLEKRAQGGMFNGELLRKLNVFRIEMPDLLKRKDEFDDIVVGLLGEITRELHKEHLRDLSDAVWQHFRTYDWPGNLRELRNVLRVAVLTAKNDHIEMSDLPDFGRDKLDFRATREEFERIYIIELLKTFDWQVDRTCQVNRLDKKVLLSKIEKYRIRLPDQNPTIS